MAWFLPALALCLPPSVTGYSHPGNGFDHQITGLHLGILHFNLRKVEEKWIMRNSPLFFFQRITHRIMKSLFIGHRIKLPLLLVCK